MPQGQTTPIATGRVRPIPPDGSGAPAAAGRGRLIIVSNRGPHDFVWRDGRWTATRAAGGLVSMIEPLARRPDVAWYCCVSEPPDAKTAPDSILTLAADQVDPELGVVPVPVPSCAYHQYYGLISNEVLWMLQHRLSGQFGCQHLDARRHQAWREGYLEVNRRIADAIAATGPAPGAFLVQDYHLYPLPRLLRARFPRAPILHFTHIPFPDSLSLRLIPADWRRTLLEGLLGADVVGMQTRADVQNFATACASFLGLPADEAASTVVCADGRVVRLRAFPASVDPAAVRSLVESASREAGPPAGNGVAGADPRAAVVRVDRLDPSKNQIVGFMAYERLLEMRPELIERVRFDAFLIPSRTDQGAYRQYRDAVWRVIERINARFTDPSGGGNAVNVFYTNDRTQALAALVDCDVLLANSHADGMNLVVKEWAVVSKRPGALIVSETAGVASETGGHALLVSPLDVEGTAQALSRALDMPRAERAARLASIRDSVLGWTANDWLTGQLHELEVIAGALPA